MRIVETKIYPFSELPPKSQQKVCDDYRQNLHGWDFGTMEDAKQIAVYLGIIHCDIAYSGFWSQGDGASFTGSWAREGVQLEALKSHTPTDTELHRIAEELAKAPASLNAEITRSGRYVHENSMDYEFWSDSEVEFTQAQIVPLEYAFKSFAQWIYCQLESDYNNQTTEEAIAEAVADNEYYEDGQLYLGDEDESDDEQD